PCELVDPRDLGAGSQESRRLTEEIEVDPKKDGTRIESGEMSSGPDRFISFDLDHKHLDLAGSDKPHILRAADQKNFIHLQQALFTLSGKDCVEVVRLS